MPDEQVFQKRQTAYKIRIIDILNSEYIKTEGFAPNYLEIGGREISRVNVIGVIVDKSDLNNYKALTIEDGTGNISARIFENNTLLDVVVVGNIVLITGRPRDFSSEKYILIETIKNIDPNWAKVRELELKNITTIENKLPSAEKVDVGEKIVSNSTNEIFKLIKGLDKGAGVPIEELSSKNIKEMDKIIDMLLKEGNIFEVKPGKLKVLE